MENKKVVLFSAAALVAVLSISLGSALIVWASETKASSNTDISSSIAAPIGNHVLKLTGDPSPGCQSARGMNRMVILCAGPQTQSPLPGK